MSSAERATQALDQYDVEIDDVLHNILTAIYVEAAIATEKAVRTARREALEEAERACRGISGNLALNAVRAIPRWDGES